MTKYQVEFDEKDLQTIKDCHTKNPSIMAAIEKAKKIEE